MPELVFVIGYCFRFTVLTTCVVLRSIKAAFERDRHCVEKENRLRQCAGVETRQDQKPS